MNKRPALIIGAGYLGARLAQHLQQDGRAVSVYRRQADKNPELPCIELDINRPQSWQAIDIDASTESVDLYCLIPPSKIDIPSFADFAQFLQHLPIRRAVLSSSTVVYGSRDRIVDADSEVAIESERAERQYQIEQTWRAAGEHFMTIRLAGLYGPGRVMGQRALQANQPVNSTASGFLNLLYIDDAVSAVAAMMAADDACAAELACDDQPVIRLAYYQEVARLLGCPDPRFASTRAGSLRQCANEATCRRLNWRPEMADYRVGLEQALTTGLGSL